MQKPCTHLANNLLLSLTSSPQISHYSLHHRRKAFRHCVLAMTTRPSLLQVTASLMVLKCTPSRERPGICSVNSSTPCSWHPPSCASLGLAKGSSFQTTWRRSAFEYAGSASTSQPWASQSKSGKVNTDPWEEIVWILDGICIGLTCYKYTSPSSLAVHKQWLIQDDGKQRKCHVTKDVRLQPTNAWQCANFLL